MNTTTFRKRFDSINAQPVIELLHQIQRLGGEEAAAFASGLLHL